jgi:hypothetical protein
MQVHEGSIADSLGIAISHPDHHGFLQTQRVLKIRREIAKKRQFGRTRISKNPGETELPQKVNDCVANGWRSASLSHG